MTQGVVASFSVQHKTIRAPGHDHVLFSMAMKASQGVLRAGLIVAKDVNGDGIPYDSVSETLGTGTGTQKNFTGTITGGRLEPGTVSVTDGTESFIDDRFGHLIGDAGGTGSVIYLTGGVSVSFNAAVANGTDVTAAGSGEIAGVLDRDVDTDKSDPGIVVVHGPVKEAELIKGATPVACSAVEFELLRKHTIYPV